MRGQEQSEVKRETSDVEAEVGIPSYATGVASEGKQEAGFREKQDRTTVDA